MVAGTYFAIFLLIRGNVADPGQPGDVSVRLISCYGSEDALKTEEHDCVVITRT
jgi:hypothetical protein